MQNIVKKYRIQSSKIKKSKFFARKVKKIKKCVDIKILKCYINLALEEVLSIIVMSNNG